MIGTNGKERNTSLRDARKLRLVPSVTAINGVIAKQGLIDWQFGQVLNAALEWPYTGGDVDVWKKEVLYTAGQIGREAAKKGNEVHNELEKAFTSGKHEMVEIVLPVLSEMLTKFGYVTWISEASFSHEAGFGGKVDLHCNTAIVDFKTKSIDSFEKHKPYFEYCMQLAAYRYGLNLPAAKCYNVMVSVTKPGEVLIYEWSEEELKRGLDMFLCLLKYWQLSNKYMMEEK